MKKFDEISFLNVLLCLLVIFIHVASEPVSAFAAGSLAHGLIFIPWRLAAFVVQGFIFLSGLKMFLNSGKKKNFSCKKYYAARLKKIVLPYVIMVVVFYLYFVKEKYFGFSVSNLLGYIFKGDLCAHFYFVIAVIQFYALIPVWRWMIKSVKATVAIPAALVITIVCGQYLPDLIRIVSGGYNFIYNDRIFTTYILYWVAGCYVGANYNSFRVIMLDKRVRLGAAVMFVVAAAADGGLSFIMAVKNIQIMQLENLHIIYCISAIVFFSTLASMLGEKTMKNIIVRTIDKASYYIYLIHPLVIFIVNSIIHKLGIMKVDIAFVIRTIVTYTVSVVLCGAYAEVKGKIISKRV